MKSITILSFFCFLTLLSCKKNRTCECSNAYATYDAGDVDKTKGRAKKYCESLSAGETKCKLK